MVDQAEVAERLGLQAPIADLACGPQRVFQKLHGSLGPVVVRHPGGLTQEASGSGPLCGRIEGRLEAGEGR